MCLPGRGSRHQDWTQSCALSASHAVPVATVSITLRISEEELAAIKKAAEKLWPAATFSLTAQVRELLRELAKCSATGCNTNPL